MLGQKIRKFFRWFFRIIEDTTITLWNFPTFKGLISERVSFCLTSPKMDAKSVPWAFSLFKVDSAQQMDLASIFGDISQKENFLRLSHL